MNYVDNHKKNESVLHFYLWFISMERAMFGY